MSEELNEVETTPQASETVDTTDTNEGQSEENTDSVAENNEGEGTSEEPQYFTVKHLKEEKKISHDEAPSYIQKGLDYDRVRERYDESKPMVEFIENLAKSNNMSVNEYMEAVTEHTRQQEIEKIAEQNALPEELAEELYLLRQERKERAVEKEQMEKEREQQQEYMDFINEFPNVKYDEVPKEVFDIKANNPRISISDAYMRYQYNQMMEKEKADTVNQNNSKASAGSVASDQTNNSDFITFEEFESKKSDRGWVVKNLSKIQNSRKKW